MYYRLAFGTWHEGMKKSVRLIRTVEDALQRAAGDLSGDQLDPKECGRLIAQYLESLQGKRYRRVRCYTRKASFAFCSPLGICFGWSAERTPNRTRFTGRFIFKVHLPEKDQRLRQIVDETATRLAEAGWELRQEKCDLFRDMFSVTQPVAQSD